MYMQQIVRANNSSVKRNIPVLMIRLHLCESLKQFYHRRAINKLLNTCVHCSLKFIFEIEFGNSAYLTTY